MEKKNNPALEVYEVNIAQACAWSYFWSVLPQERVKPHKCASSSKCILKFSRIDHQNLLWKAFQMIIVFQF